MHIAFAAIQPQFDDQPSFGTLAFQNGLQYCNFDFCKSRRHVVRFGSVTPELNT